MKSFSFASATVAAGLLSTAAAALTNPIDPIVAKGSKFFYKTNGTQFYIQGVAYQPGDNNNGTLGGSTNTNFTDPLAASQYSSCQRDVPVLKQLSTNLISVYSVDPTQDHSQCMQLLNDNDIYVLLDLASPAESINSADPAWNDDLYARYVSVIDAFANYTNVFAFLAGNEIVYAPNNTNASPFVKAAIRDSKAYISSKSYRTIPVGYATDDVESIRGYEPAFFNCGSDQSEATDFWGYNIYSWCGSSSYTQSGYADRTDFFKNFSVPVFFAEYGCTTPPRNFDEVGALFGSNMTSVWSGGIVYEYFEESNKFGLVSVSGNSVSKLAAFTSYSSQIAKVTPTGVNSNSYNPTNSAQACPANNVNWTAAASPLPPTPNQELCSCMLESAACVVSPKVSSDDYETLFGTVCGEGAQYGGGSSFCNAISAFGNNATYGAYSMCNATEQLSFLMNLFYNEQKQSSSACNFGGSATLKAATSATGACSALLSQAGSAGTGTVTSQPTGTGAGDAGSGSGGSKSSSSSSGAAGQISLHHVEVGMLSIAFYVCVAGLSGAAMILL